MILTHACLSCYNSHQFYLGKLLRQRQFAWIAAAALEGRGGWVFVILGWIKRRECDEVMITGGKKNLQFNQILACVWGV